jgi:hypothetical protein
MKKKNKIPSPIVKENYNKYADDDSMVQTIIDNILTVEKVNDIVLKLKEKNVEVGDSSDV